MLVFCKTFKKSKIGNARVPNDPRKPTEETCFVYKFPLNGKHTLAKLLK